MMPSDLIIRSLGCVTYQTCWQQMQAMTNARKPETRDEIWLLEHPPVFTLGQNAKREHILKTSDIPIIQVDRGGQVTYHSPGQLILYTLLDVRRLNLTIREFVNSLENSIIQLLAKYQLKAYAKPHAPGVYLGDKKIAAIGLRIRKGCAFHGLALNVSNDLTPFSYINPCGFEGLKITRFSDFHPAKEIQALGLELIHLLAENLRYTKQILAVDNPYGF